MKKLLILFAVLLVTCGEKHDIPVPEYTPGMDNLTVYYVIKNQCF